MALLGEHDQELVLAIVALALGILADLERRRRARRRRRKAAEDRHGKPEDLRRDRSE